MKITISCSYGTWRPVNLASQLDKMGYLHRLYVPYHRSKFPYSSMWKYFGLGKAQEIDVEPDKISTNLYYTLLNEPIRRGWPLAKSLWPKRGFILGEIADKGVAKRLDGKSDIVIAESVQALYTVKKAKELGAVGIVDRTNAHVEFQTELLREEFKKFGQEYEIDPRFVEKGVKEYQEADNIFVLSSFAKRTFLDRGFPEDKFFVIPPGVDLNSFYQVDKKDDVFRVIYCGGVQLKKGIQYLIRAFNELKLKNSELWLIGGVYDEMKPILKEHEGDYMLIGYVPNGLLYKYYSQGSVFVLPSIEEGFGKVILEAMACGLPAIVSTNTAADDVVRNNVDGFITPIRDVGALKEKISYLYYNADVRREMGQRAKERVREEFTLEAYAKRVIHSCEKILDGPC